MANYLEFQKMKDAVVNYLKKEIKYTNVQEYSDKLVPARVPIFAIKKNSDGRIVESACVDIIAEVNINCDSYFTKDFEVHNLIPIEEKMKDASSARFFKHYFPQAKVYWAIPYKSLDIANFDAFYDKCLKYNIGLLKVKENPDSSYSVILHGKEPKTLIDERVEQIEQFIKDACVKKKFMKSEELEKTLNSYSSEDIDYLVFYPDPIYKRRNIAAREPWKNISKPLINKMNELKNLSYKEILTNFSNDYNNKNEDDYDIALKTTELLWKSLNINFPDLHKDFEVVLKLRSRYRDHFLHAFQVFLFGAYVLDNLYPLIDKNAFSDKNGWRIEDAWLLASTYHDYAYMVQLFNVWTEDFFKKALNVKSGNLANLDLSKCFIQDDYMFKTKILAENIGVAIDNISLGFFHDRIFERKNHGLISALSLLKLFDTFSGGQKKPISEYVINTAAKAIALHDNDIWQYFAGRATAGEDDRFGKEFNEKKLIDEITIKKNPITFLLNLSDNLQEEGRVNLLFDKEYSKMEFDVTLQELNFTDGKIHTEILFTGKDARNAFDRKKKDFDLIEDFLKGEDIFHIQIACQHNKRKSSETYEI